MLAREEQQILQEYKEACGIYVDCRLVDTALKNKFVSILKDTYISPLGSTYTGYASKMTLDSISHLYSN